MDYMIGPGKGGVFCKILEIDCQAVASHPSASFFELDNEPMSIHRVYFDTWKAAVDAIHQVIPDASVSICDLGEASLLPSWLPKFADDFDISKSTMSWIQSGKQTCSMHGTTATCLILKICKLFRESGISQLLPQRRNASSLRRRKSQIYHTLIGITRLIATFQIVEISQQTGSRSFWRVHFGLGGRQ